MSQAYFASAIPCNPIVELGFPLMALFAEPPIPFSTPIDDVARGESPVFRRMPLFGYLGIDRVKVIEARQDLLVDAVRAPTLASDAIGDNLLKIVALFANPPNFAI